MVLMRVEQRANGEVKVALSLSFKTRLRCSARLSLRSSPHCALVSVSFCPDCSLLPAPLLPCVMTAPPSSLLPRFTSEQLLQQGYFVEQGWPLPGLPFLDVRRTERQSRQRREERQREQMRAPAAHGSSLRIRGCCAGTQLFHAIGIARELQKNAEPARQMRSTRRGSRRSSGAPTTDSLMLALRAVSAAARCSPRPVPCRLHSVQCGRHIDGIGAARAAYWLDHL